ncbi:MAG TPA: hypothetical protein VIL44_02700 [Micromonospora sp.]
MTDHRPRELEELADRIAYWLGQITESAPEDEQARAWTLVADARQAVQENGPPERIQMLIDELRRLETILCARETPAGETCSRVSAGAARTQPVDEPVADVVDADYWPH